jgi:hypothetical protein
LAACPEFLGQWAKELLTSFVLLISGDIPARANGLSRRKQWALK